MHRQASVRRMLVDRLRDRLLLVCVASVLAVAVYVVAGRQLVQLVPDFRVQVETLLSERLQATVSVGYLGARMDGLTPVLEMANVSLASAEHDAEIEPLRIRRLELGVDVLPSLLNRGLRASELLVEGVQVRLEKRTDGRFMLKGIEALGRTDQPHDPQALRRLLAVMYRQKNLLVNSLDVIIDLPDSEPLVFTDVEMIMATSGERHRFALLAREREERLSLDVRFSLSGDAYSLADINGSGYVRVSAENPDFLDPHLPDLPVQLSGSTVDIKSWLTVRAGEAVDGYVRVRAAGVPLTHSYLSRPVVIEEARISGALSREGDSYQLVLAASQAQVDKANVSLPQVNLLLTPETEQQPLAWAVTAAGIDLAVLHQTLRKLPLVIPEKYKSIDAMVAEMAPTGVLESTWLAGQQTRVEQFSVRFSGLEVKPRGKAPGARGVSGWLAGTPASGVMSLDSDEMTLLLPALYHQPLSAAVAGHIGWQHDGERTRLRTGWLSVSNADALGKAQAMIRLAPDQVPRLSLVASLVKGNAGNAAKYIPLKRLPEAASSWLADAFVDGRVDRGRFIYEGPVKIDPDYQQRRTLQMAFDVRRATLQFLPDWPRITDLSGHVVIDGRRITGRRVAGRFMSTVLSNVSADIPEYEGEQIPTLILSGHADGPARDLQSVLQDTPLAEALPGELARWQMPAGNVDADLLVHWPLRKDAGLAQTFIASGRVQQATLASPALGLTLSQVTGDVFFHLRDGLFSRQFSARVLGGDASGSITTDGQAIRVDTVGGSTVAEVAQWLDAGWMKPASGAFQYQAQVALPWRQDGPVRVSARSDLKPVVVSLPAPLYKSAGTAWPLSLKVLLDDPGPRVDLAVPGLVSGWLQLDDNGLSAARIGLGEITGLEQQAADVQVEGALEQFAVEPWVDWLSADSGTGEALPLKRLALTTEQLDLYGMQLNQALLVILPQDNGWAVAVDSDQLAGSVSLPSNYSLRGATPMSVEISRGQLVGDGDAYARLDPRQIPVADVRISGVSVDDEDMGSWSMKLRPLADGVEVKDLQATWRFTQMAGKATWTQVGDDQYTRFLGAASSDHLKRTSLAWELPPLVEGRKGEAVMDLTWPGSPLDVDYLATRGHVSVDIGPSRIPNTDTRTSALRMLGVMNFGSVSRRLRLDFSDLYKKGLSCDRISGDFKVDGPEVETRNLIIKSPSAEFRVAGTINMAEETVNQRVDVTLPVSSNLYLGCLAGPTACAGIFVVERLWGAKLEKMTSVAYAVTGPWADPDVKEIEGMFERKK